MRGLAHVGITALVDEATGYQEVRDKQALQAILDQFLRKELAAWAKRFPDEFYNQMFRLKGWQRKDLSSPSRRPGAAGMYTNDIVYERLAPGIVQELEMRNPKDAKGNRKGKHHQLLTEDVGHPALAQHVHALIALMRASTSWDQFMLMLNTAFPKKNDTLLLDLQPQKHDLIKVIPARLARAFLCLEENMGAAAQIDIRGEKGGSSKPKSPTEANDSLRSTNLAKMLIAVGEGEFDSAPTDYDIYLDNTPIKDASGNINFPNVKWDWRSGSVDQSYIPGIPSVENETTLNVELRSDPWVRSITNTQLSAARVRFAWPALQAQDEEGIGGYRIEYAIDVATDGGAYQQVLLEAVDGKTTTRYERSRRVDLPPATSGWLIRVRRLTPNQNSNKVADTMLIAGLTEVIDAKLRYPNTALLYIEFDAEQFTNIPAVTVKCKARKWQVPSNYDPVARTYTGTWDGTMKQAWTNNPAWITYGICTEDRFGLGKRIKPYMVDKWELYRISQYCDQNVPNGLGGQEPRFLCDMNLQGKADAWSLLRDIAGIYRGMTYWAQGQLVMQADMPRAQDYDYVFTRANVVDGKFSYGSASAKTRYTRALVSYDNPANNYDTDVIPFADLELQRRFGDKPTELTAIGCTRASEAQRRGKWAILSNNQDRTINFKTGMEGVIPLPGHIIPVADSLLAGRQIGGRISAVAGRVVTLDRDTQAKAGDRLIINLPGGRAEGRTVQSVTGRAVTVTAAYSEPPLPQLQWALDADDLAIPLYRVLSTKRTTEGDFEISALQYEPGKFAFIDTGARLEERPISVIPITVVPPPASVTLTSNYAVDQGIAVSTMNISWPAVNGAVAYDVEWRKDSGNWIKVQRTGATSVDVTGIYAGAYLARVRAVSAFDISSIWKSSSLTQLKGKEGCRRRCRS